MLVWPAFIAAFATLSAAADAGAHPSSDYRSPAERLAHCLMEGELFQWRSVPRKPLLNKGPLPIIPPLEDAQLIVNRRPIHESGQSVAAAYRVTVHGRRCVFKPIDFGFEMLSDRVREMKELHEVGGPEPLYVSSIEADGEKKIGIVMEEIPGRPIDALKKGDINPDELSREVRRYFDGLARRNPPVMLDDPNPGNFIVNRIAGKLRIRPIDQAVINLDQGAGAASPEYARRQRDIGIKRLMNYIDRYLR